MRKTLLIDVETYIIFLASVFFTLLWISTRGDQTRNAAATLWGVISGLCWVVLGITWIFLSAGDTIAYSTISISLLWDGIGVMFWVVVILDQINLGKRTRELDGDVDLGL